MRGTITIEELLDHENVGKIDFMSLDVEGNEMDVLSMFDFEKHVPSIVIVEYNAAHLPITFPSNSPIPYLMKARGYKLRKTFEPVNMIFTK